MEAENKELEKEVENDKFYDFDFELNEIISDAKIESNEKQTTPPKRYTEASLVKELDKLGIGRPSTFATTIKNVLDSNRGYATLVNKEIVPTLLGINQVKWLKTYFNQIVDVKNRANLEKQLDLISEGKLNRDKVLADFWNDLKSQVDKVAPNMNEEKICSKCGSKMVIRKGKYGLFWGCSNYPQCNNIEPIKKKK